jgi:alkylation response protein AidB-like acyl-CoA dehydrogenase
MIDELATHRRIDVEAGPSFSLAGEQKALRELAHDFAAKEIRPKASEYDEHSIHPADIIARPTRSAS